LPKKQYYGTIVIGSVRSKLMHVVRGTNITDGFGVW
jgi:hypothetical protein